MSGDKIKIDIGYVQKTLLLPLWGRAEETKKEHPLLKDTAALDIINKIDYDFSIMTANINFISKLAWIGRSILTDRMIKKFLQDNPDGTVVNIGCGLDTTFDRVDNGKVTWFELDLPDVIELRKKFIPESPRRRYIAKSLLDSEWFSCLPQGKKVMFLSCGVMYYIPEDLVKCFFKKIITEFPGCEIFFDAASPYGVKAANKFVIKAGGMDENSFLKWGLEDIKLLKTWDPSIREVKKYSFFTGLRRHLTIKQALMTYLSDYLKIMFMIHIKTT